MQFVILGVHSPEACPTANAKTRPLLVETGPQIPAIAEKHGVKILAGPLVNREHTTVVIVEANGGEDIDAFLWEARLPQWNTVRILPSHSMEEGMREIGSAPPLF
jgi:hypothetical protein